MQICGRIRYRGILSNGVFFNAKKNKNPQYIANIVVVLSLDPHTESEKPGLKLIVVSKKPPKIFRNKNLYLSIT